MTALTDGLSFFSLRRKPVEELYVVFTATYTVGVKHIEKSLQPPVLFTE
jgi:hypothetical protein